MKEEIKNILLKLKDGSINKREALSYIKKIKGNIRSEEFNTTIDYNNEKVHISSEYNKIDISHALYPAWSEVLTHSKLVVEGNTLVINMNSDLKIEESSIKGKYINIPIDSSLENIECALRSCTCIKNLIWIAPIPQCYLIDSDKLLEEQYLAIQNIFRCIKVLLNLGYQASELYWKVITFQTIPYLCSNTSPAYSSIYGLLMSAVKEFPSWHVNIIDVDNININIEQILSLGDSSQLNILRKGKIYRQILAKNGNFNQTSSSYRNKGVYVILGGAGGLGESWSKYMISEYDANVVWIGRSKINNEIQMKLDALSKFGKTPIYISADVTNEIELSEALNYVLNEYGTINGIIHSIVGDLDLRLSVVEEEMFLKKMSSKVESTFRLFQAIKQIPLDFVLMFSSVASFCNLAGQSSYSASSIFEDVYALSSCNHIVKIVNWGFWGNIGIGKKMSNIFKERIINGGMEVIEPEKAWKVLDYFMGTNIS